MERNKIKQTEIITEEDYRAFLKQTNFDEPFKAWLKLKTNEFSISSFEKYFGALTSDQCLTMQKQYDEYCKLRNYNFRFPSEFSLNEQRTGMPEIIALERKLCLRIVLTKEYVKEENRFYVLEAFFKKTVKKSFELFGDFYTYLNGDIKGANLVDYEFSKKELADYDLSAVHLNSALMLKQGRYDDSFYRKTIVDYSNEVNFTPAQISEDEYGLEISHPDVYYDSTLNEAARRIYYISDLHLNHKLLNQFPERATKAEVVFYIKKIILSLKASALNGELGCNDFLLIGGDISFCFEIAEIFYCLLVKEFRPSQIIVVLGNHDLWDYNRFGNKKNDSISLHDVIKNYQELFSKLGIIFLNNSLFIMNGRKNFYNDYLILPEKELLQMSAEDIRNKCLESNFIIFGGLGYSAYNPIFNAKQGIYRGAITSYEQDLEQTIAFEKAYDKVYESLSDHQVIVLTHTSKENWSKKPYNPKWIYVSGHDHHNRYILNDDITLYADNQIGYKVKTFGLKYFRLSTRYDIFRFLGDGIYKISAEQYKAFNYGIGIPITFNRTDYKVTMLKREGIYLFLGMRDNSKKIYILNGGGVKSLIKTNIDYYYGNMVLYANIIKDALSEYNNILKTISKEVKAIGGEGIVHGSIVDIDFYNHIYLNPYDGKVTAYFSPELGSQRTYKDIPSLLKEKCPELYKNFKKLLSQKNAIVPLMSDTDAAYAIENWEIGMEIYEPSLILRKMQYLTDFNVIRFCDENILLSTEKSLSIPKTSQIENH